MSIGGTRIRFLGRSSRLSQPSQKEKGKDIRKSNRKERINMQGIRVESLPRLTILILRERAAGPPKKQHEPGAIPRRQVPDRRARGRNAGAPKFS